MQTPRMQVLLGDITRLQVDAIVNAANESLLGGGGVDGAIHRAAGPDLFAECRRIGGCPEGEVRLTHGYRLPAKHIIHTVGPVWDGGGYQEEKTLRKCYRESLSLADRYRFQSIAFPCIATGVYLFPRPLACEIAVSTVADWLKQNQTLDQVIFCCFEHEDFDLYEMRLAAVR